MNELERSKYIAAIYIAITALEFYGNLKYDYRMGLPSDVQFVAEDAIKTIQSLVNTSYLEIKKGLDHA